MKRNLLRLFFILIMIVSVGLISEAISANSPFSAQAQTAKVKKKKVGLIRKAYRGGKYIGKQVWTGTKWVGVKTAQGAAVIARTTGKGTKYVAKKTWKGAKKVSRKTKKVIY